MNEGATRRGSAMQVIFRSACKREGEWERAPKPTRLRTVFLLRQLGGRTHLPRWLVELLPVWSPEPTLLERFAHDAVALGDGFIPLLTIVRDDVRSQKD
jgi:hypothetical protein